MVIFDPKRLQNPKIEKNPQGVPEGVQPKFGGLGHPNWSFLTQNGHLRPKPKFGGLGRPEW